MSCFSCNLCSCSVASESKTQIIVLPTQTSREYMLKSKCNGYRVKRTNRSSNKFTQQKNIQDNKFVITSTSYPLNKIQSEALNQDKQYTQNDNSINVQMKINQTIDTISKLKSIPSTQLLIHKSEVQHKLDHNKAINIQQMMQQKQNIDSNFCQSRLTDNVEQKPKLSIRSSPTKKMRNSHAGNINSVGISCKSLKVSQICIFSPHSNAGGQRSLETILIQKENDQLRDELKKLKKQEKQLLEAQQKLKIKTNRQVNHLKKRSQQLEHKSEKRKKQLQELKQILNIVQKSRKYDD